MNKELERKITIVNRTLEHFWHDVDKAKDSNGEFAEYTPLYEKNINNIVYCLEDYKAVVSKLDQITNINLNENMKLLLDDFNNVVNKCDLGNLHSNKKTLLQLSKEIEQKAQAQEQELAEIKVKIKQRIIEVEENLKMYKHSLKLDGKSYLEKSDIRIHIFHLNSELNFFKALSGKEERE